MRVIACLALFAVAMLAVRFGAHWIVETGGVLAGLAVILAMYGAARWYERRNPPPACWRPTITGKS